MNIINKQHSKYVHEDVWVQTETCTM